VAVCAKSEDIELDPDLNKACSNDVTEHCRGVKPGRAQVCFCEYYYILYRPSSVCSRCTPATGV